MYYLFPIMKAVGFWRRTFLVALMVLCQGVLAVHDAQHIDEPSSTCSVCQAHLPLISSEPGSITPVLPMIQVIAAAPRSIPIVETPRRYSSFQSRAPPRSHV